ncbi:MAG: hypothetical protein JJ966_14035 [Balneolaceae bacterium]|nr:hypothetical protein [Balneolaceae bacterium]
MIKPPIESMIKSTTVFSAIILVLLITMASCDTERVINPFEESIGSYSVYGAVELNEDKNLIRIRDVSIPFLADSSVGYNDIDVSLKEVETGRNIGLRDTTINYNGNYTLNFIIQEDLQPRVAYTFEISYENEEIVYSTFTMPGVGTLRINRDPVQDCYHKVRFTWDNVLAPEYVLAEAGVNYNGQTFWGEVERVDEPDHVPGTNTMDMELTVRNLLVDIFPPPIGGEGASNTPPEFWKPEVECHQLDNNEIYIRYIHFGPEWEQFEETDYYVFDMLDSGQIENGIGFLGGIRRGILTFSVDDLN